jgi:hypothetical protein
MKFKSAPNKVSLQTAPMLVLGLGAERLTGRYWRFMFNRHPQLKFRYTSHRWGADPDRKTAAERKF